MKEIPKTVTSKTKIRFQDCDPFNHLNNGSYINYFMNHREDMLIEHYNVDIYALAKTICKSWVSSTNQIAYLRPAFLMETVTIESQLIRYTDTDLLVEMRMYNKDKTELKAIIWCGFVHFNLLKQSREKHDENFMNLFKDICHPLENITTFEQRIQGLKPRKKEMV
ncbi:acyl-CoA thioesterase [Aureibaculum sp. 2210JD6-5]|uniref:acyl-CoA thioesterase n=1 Tax=Aureibaculum sp. 2210JD6-5 TaxID=3103957 RepID=UPI002AAEB785|nr:acyl-CoA thioesterase [Aureibaculum sp. 2210JD6-5]MDY7395083.1 acyl-CoA thioesterase [Aureibaculum sp. 2210JD6-5]